MCLPIGYTGCSTDVTSFLETLCAGKHKCDVPVMSIADPFQPCRKDFITYLEAGYRCIKGWSTYICCTV